MNPKVIKGTIPNWCAGSSGYGDGNGFGYGNGDGFGYGARIRHISLGSGDTLCQESTEDRVSIQEYIQGKKDPYYYWCPKCEEDPRVPLLIIGSVEF